MNRIWTRLVRSTYRKEPISGFILTAGAVDAVIGGVGGHLSLMILGLSAVGVAIGLRWWAGRQHQFERLSPEAHSAQPPIRYLPEKASRPSLPTLTPSRRRS
jgi:hypothetical protein